MEGKDGKHDRAATMEAPPAGAPQPAAPPTAESARWGTRQMGPPAAPGAHPENQEAARWTAARGDQELPPYVIMGEPVAAPPQHMGKGDSPMEHILAFFNTWSRKAEELASNIWFNLKTAPSMSDAAMGKISLGAKALSEGGFDKLYKQTFSSSPEEHLKKTFACYLSTATGPVAGTLYLTNINVAFCSDRPLSFTAPSGQTAWSYYKVVIPLGKIATVEPVTMKENGEVRPHRHRGLARLLVHGLRQLRQGRAQSRRGRLPALPVPARRRLRHRRQQVMSRHRSWDRAFGARRIYIADSFCLCITCVLLRWCPGVCLNVFSVTLCDTDAPLLFYPLVSCDL